MNTGTPDERGGCRDRDRQERPRAADGTFGASTVPVNGAKVDLNNKSWLQNAIAGK